MMNRLFDIEIFSVDYSCHYIVQIIYNKYLNSQ